MKVNIERVNTIKPKEKAGVLKVKFQSVIDEQIEKIALRKLEK